MKKALLIVISLATSACATMESKEVGPDARNVLDFCVSEIARLTGSELSTEIDRAYVYSDRKGAWVIFSHGEIGTFGERNVDTSIVLNCAALYEPSMKLVFLGAPMKDALIDEPGREYFGTPEGTTEALFKREDGRFKYCCEQPFDEKNFEKHNPGLPWSKDQVGS